MAIYYGDGSNSTAGRTVQTAQYNFTGVASSTSDAGFRAMMTGANLTVKNSDSKILITVSCGRISGPSNSVAARVLRDRGGVDIQAIGVHTDSTNASEVSWQNYGQGPVNNDHADGHTWQWLDTHGKAAGGAVYYQVQFWGQGSGTIYLNRTQNANDTNEPYAARTGSAIILTEITV